MARGRDLSDFERGFIVGARQAGASVTRTAQLAGVSIGTVAKVTAAFRATGKTSVSRVGHCGRQRTLDARDARVLVQLVQKNRSATLSQLTQRLNARRNTAVSARTVRRLLHREGYYKEEGGQEEDQDLEGQEEDQDLEGQEDQDLEGQEEDQDLEGQEEDQDLEGQEEDQDLEGQEGEKKNQGQEDTRTETEPRPAGHT